MLFSIDIETTRDRWNAKVIALFVMVLLINAALYCLISTLILYVLNWAWDMPLWLSVSFRHCVAVGLLLMCVQLLNLRRGK